MSPEYAFMEMALSIAKLSKDPNTKVGCILASPDHKSVATGYNGFPSGLPESDHMWADKTSKDLICKGTAVLHAEENALLNARQSVQGWSAYVTHHPCVRCKGMLGHSGIRQVHYTYNIKPEYKPGLALILAQQMGITVRCLKPIQSFSIIQPVPNAALKTTLESTQMGMGSVLGASTVSPPVGIPTWQEFQQWSPAG